MKLSKKYFIPLVLILVVTLVTAAFYPEPFTSNIDMNDLNITNADYIEANTFAGIFTGNVTGSMNWTFLKNYPTECPGSGAITKLNDTTVCSDLWVDVAGDTITGNLTFSTSEILNLSDIECLDWTNVTITESQVSDFDSYYLPTYCYQEFANVSTACGGLATGTYTLTGTWTDIAALYTRYLCDGDWGTECRPHPSPGQAEMYINYSRVGGSGPIWMVMAADGGVEYPYNITIPDECFTDPVQLKVDDMRVPIENISYWCHNSTDWIHLYEHGLKMVQS
ncbi:unnamed protein product [marine sediment metagenome]|uniref:Uncharacterized protein n=1 Tax=marine sediment metagenome TaxID=412755 RepID=X1A054_9ZZZZ